MKPRFGKDIQAFCAKLVSNQSNFTSEELKQFLSVNEAGLEVGDLINIVVNGHEWAKRVFMLMVFELEHMYEEEARVTSYTELGYTSSTYGYFRLCREGFIGGSADYILSQAGLDGGLKGIAISVTSNRWVDITFMTDTIAYVHITVPCAKEVE